MAQICSICNNPKVLEINRELATAKSITLISRKFGVAYDSLVNHRDNHLSRQLIKAWEMKQSLEGLDILNSIESLITRTKTILDTVEGKKQYGLALSAIREVRGSYELLSKIAFSLHSARLQEIELERMKSGTDQEEQNRELAERIKILSDDELTVLMLLQRKVRMQNKDLQCLPLKYRTIPDVWEEIRFGNDYTPIEEMDEETTENDEPEEIEDIYKDLKVKYL